MLRKSSFSSVTTVAVVLLLLSVAGVMVSVQGHCVLEDPTHSTIGCVPTPAPTASPSTLPSSVPSSRPSSTPTQSPTGYIVYTTVGIEILVEDILLDEEETRNTNSTNTTPILNATQIEYFEQQTALYLQNTTAAYPEIYKIEIEDVVVTQQHTVQHSSNTSDAEGEEGSTDLVVTVNVIAAVMLNTTNLDAEENEDDNTVVTPTTTTTTPQPERLSSSSLPVSARENVPHTNTNNNKSNTVLSTFLQQFFQEPNHQNSLRAQLIATNSNSNNIEDGDDTSSSSAGGGGGELFHDIIQPRIEVEEEQDDTNNKMGIGASVGWTILGMVLGLSVAAMVLYGLILAPARRRHRRRSARAERSTPPQKPEDVLMLEIGGTRSSNDETQRHSNSQHHNLIHTKVLANRYEADVIPCTTSSHSSSNNPIWITTSNILNDDESNIDIPDTPGPSIETSVYTQNFHYNGVNGQDETQSTASNYSTQSAAAPPPSRMKIHLYSVESNTSYTTENVQNDHNNNGGNERKSEDGSQKEDALRRRQHLPPTSYASKKKKDTSITFINSVKSKMGLPPSLPSHTKTQDDKKKDTIELTFGSHIDLTSALNNNRRKSSESTTSVLAGTNNITMVNTDENDAIKLNRTPSWC